MSSYEHTRTRFDTSAVAEDYILKKNPPGWRNQRELRCIDKALSGIKAPARILDLPSGTGRVAMHLARLGFEVVAADYSLHMLNVAERAWRAECAGDSTLCTRIQAFQQQDIQATGYADGEFAAVICNRLLHHYTESKTRVSVLTELARISSHRVVASFFSSRSLSSVKFHLRNRIRGKIPTDRIPIATAQLAREAEQAGLRLISSHPVLLGVSSQTYASFEKI